MSIVNVAEFKAHLGRYLGLVRRGRPVVVADRGTPIATVVPYEGDTAAKVHVRKATKDPKKLARLRYPPLPAKKVDSLELLLEERGDRR